MIDFVWQHILPFVEGGMIVGLWLAVRDRRKAVDRMVEAIERLTSGDTTGGIKTLGFGKALQLHISLAGGPASRQDAPGRVIARSVERMTSNAK